MAEVLTPGTSPPNISYEILALHLDWARERISVWVRGPNNTIELATYTGDTAVTLMRQLNTLNLSVNSLQKRLLERLSTDGKLPSGTVSGAPD